MRTLTQPRSWHNGFETPPSIQSIPCIKLIFNTFNILILNKTFLINELNNETETAPPEGLN